MQMSLFPNLFTPRQFGGVTLPNRIVSTGHETGMADARGISDSLIVYYEVCVRGGVGIMRYRG